MKRLPQFLLKLASEEHSYDFDVTDEEDAFEALVTRCDTSVEPVKNGPELSSEVLRNTEAHREQPSSQKTIGQ